jgi:hypothetical protein
MDPRDPQSVADALRRATDPATHARLREGARETSTILTPRAAADVIATAVRQAHPAAGA